MSRRNGSVRRSSRGVQVANRWYGITSASVSDLYKTTGATGIAGVGTGFWVAFPLRIISQAVSSSNRRVASRSNYSTVGWQCFTQTTNATIVFAAYNAVNAFAGTPAYTIPSADVGATRMVHCVHTGAGNTLELWWGGVKRQTTAISGFSTSASPTYIHSDAAASNGCAMSGLVGGAGVPTDPEIEAHNAACVAAKDLVSIAGKTDHLWSFKRSGLVASLSDLVGADAMTKTGSPLLVTSVP